MESTFSPLALLVLIAGGLMVLFGPRRHLMVTLLLVGVFISMHNRIILFSLDFMVHRLVVVLGWTRLLIRREYQGIGINKIDRVMVALTLWSVASYTLLWGTSSALIYRLGIAFDMIGLYFLFRAMIRSWEDWERVIKALGVVSIVLALFLFVEFITQKNLLAMLGLTARTEEVWVRSGRIRCQAAFGHPISAGIFGASLLPLWVACWWQRASLRRWAVVGVITSTVITGASASSSTLLAYLAAWFGLCFWPLRSNMRAIRWSVALILLGLHLVMKAPVWALLARANVFGGSTGYHRFRLVDHFLTTPGEWWLFGVKDTEEWGFGLWDVCNQFVLEGVRGGVLRLWLFILILVLCFRQVGIVMRTLGGDRRRTLMVWSLGVMLFVHCVSFWGYDYWDQIILLWYLLLSTIAGLHAIVALPEPRVPSQVDNPWASQPQAVPS